MYFVGICCHGRHLSYPREPPLWPITPFHCLFSRELKFKNHTNKYLTCGAKERQLKSSGIVIIIASEKNDKRKKILQYLFTQFNPTMTYSRRERAVLCSTKSN
jgi:hypothetical protein